jgi:hypothetical protein
MRYRFYFEIEIPDEECDAKNLNDKFQKVADAVQEVCPFDDEDWDFCACEYEWNV